MIDHTVLKPETTAAQVDRLCEECRTWGFAAACVQPQWVSRVAARLAGTRTQVCSVVGFPHGANRTDVKAFEAEQAVRDGAQEIDMVIALGPLLDGAMQTVAADIRAVVEAARGVRPQVAVKVILETAALTPEHIRRGCAAAAEGRADFVKTSTGFHPAGGATPEAVALLRQHAGGLRVKASGGIRDLATAMTMIEAGADRLGLSASVAIVSALPD